jgi:glycosyltransferase involved in cell wall biosynthesis
LDTETRSIAPDTNGVLSIRLDVQLPRTVAIGDGTALFVCGTCFHRDARIDKLSFVLDGAEQPVEAHGMPRLDTFRDLHPSLDVFATHAIATDADSREDPNLRAYRSGFWGTVRIGPRPEGRFVVHLRARLDDGTSVTEPLTTLTAAAPVAVPGAGARPTASGPFVAICMATFNPPIDLFRRQIESIRAQTHRNWTCFVSDDCSDSTRFAAIEQELRDDPRFVVSRSPRRLGFYHNFERALAMVPLDAEFVALSDQDDRWYQDKLQVLLGAVERAQLAYSDLRVIDYDDRVISDTYWTHRRNNYSDLLSVLVANSVPGAASLFRRELLDHALPFPPTQFGHFHDHWIALVALSLGTIAFIPRPLYDYVQHRDAVIGHDAANRMVALHERLGSLWKDPRERVRLWRHHYFVDVSRLTQCATIVQMRCDERMDRAKRRSLDRFLRAERSPGALLNMWRRGLRELLGTTETLGGEWMLAYAFTWRRLVAATATERPRRGLRFDALPPADLWVNPGQLPAGEPVSRPIAERIAPLLLARTADAPPRVNVLIHTVDLTDVNDRLVANLNVARRLAERGLRVRIVTVDRVRPLPGRWRQAVERYQGLARLFDAVEVAFARESRDVEVSVSDRFLATTVWTAHVAARAAAELGEAPFLYLIDAYAPLTAATGSDAALAEESYALPHHALFSSELLRGYFRAHRIGVFAENAATGDRRSAAFEYPIAPIARPGAPELERRDDRRLLFDARVDDRRDMFELGVAALREVIGEGLMDGWELHAIGPPDDRRAVALGGAARLELLPRPDPAAYAALLREHDVGLRLDYLPGPSLRAIEMAAAGLVTVTNSFENKTREVVEAVSPNLLAPPPTIAGIGSALRSAAARVDDVNGRIRGSDLAWSRDWNDALPDPLIERVAGLLGH